MPIWTPSGIGTAPSVQAMPWSKVSRSSIRRAFTTYASYKANKRVRQGNTPITQRGEEQARITGRKMRESGVSCPDVIFVSPYLRTEETLRILQEEWPDLLKAKVYRDERIREKDHGLAFLYNDLRIY